jgi:hypothetical protein
VGASVPIGNSEGWIRTHSPADCAGSVSRGVGSRFPRLSVVSAMSQYGAAVACARTRNHHRIAT